jgi:penicillin-binding protein 1A
VIPTLERFGFSEDALPNNASLALGSGSVTPVELAGAYAMLANGGYATGIVNPDTGRPAPWFIERVEDADGNVLYDASQSVEHIYHNETVEDETLAESDGLINRPSELYPPLRRAERAVAAQLIYLITDVMQDVVRRGSGARAGRAFPDRRDLAGKTGTTSGPRDAWFSGFNADIVAVVRVGFDVGTRDLGGNEQGGVTAITAWIDYMQVALAGMPDRTLPRPAGIVDRRVNAETGQVAADCNRDADWEMFLADNVPERESDIRCLSGAPLPTETETRPGPDPIFD